MRMLIRMVCAHLRPAGSALPYIHAASRGRTAFTLIELLIVVAIIAILAAIAVPNFLEAQVRAKISRAKADLRTLATALESYSVDNNRYAYPANPNYPWWINGATELTTPIAYLASVDMRDPFMARDALTPANLNYLPYYYVSYGGSFAKYYGQGARIRAYCLASFGPDRDHDQVSWSIVQNYGGTVNNSEPTRLGPVMENMWYTYYDASNGTVSNGDIARFGGEVNIQSVN